jgi:choloylglycine hydrolase
MEIFLGGAFHMYIKRLVTLTTAFILSVFILCVPVNACIVFTQNNGGTVLAGNNEDWMYSCESTMAITAPQKGSYGRVCFYNFSFVQGGMNEYGLFYDGAYCPSSEVPLTKGKRQLGMDLGEQVLSKCANVEDVIKMLEDSNVPSSLSDHLIFADASGKSAVFEWMEGKLHIIRKNQSYQLITNFWLTDQSLGNYPCSRFSTADTMLKNQKLSVEGFASILNATKQNWGEGGTLYSNVYDLAKRTVYVFYNGKLDLACKVDLASQLNSMKAGDIVKKPIKNLDFNVPVVINTSIKAEVSQPPDSSEIVSAQDTQSIENSKSPASSSASAAAPMLQGTWYFLAIILVGIAALIALIWRSNRRKKL